MMLLANGRCGRCPPTVDNCFVPYFIDSDATYSQLYREDGTPIPFDSAIPLDTPLHHLYPPWNSLPPAQRPRLKAIVGTWILRSGGYLECASGVLDAPLRPFNPGQNAKWHLRAELSNLVPSGTCSWYLALGDAGTIEIILERITTPTGVRMNTVRVRQNEADVTPVYPLPSFSSSFELAWLAQVSQWRLFGGGSMLFKGTATLPQSPELQISVDAEEGAWRLKLTAMERMAPYSVETYSCNEYIDVGQQVIDWPGFGHVPHPRLTITGEHWFFTSTPFDDGVWLGPGTEMRWELFPDGIYEGTAYHSSGQMQFGLSVILPSDWPTEWPPYDFTREWDPTLEPYFFFHDENGDRIRGIRGALHANTTPRIVMPDFTEVPEAEQLVYQSTTNASEVIPAFKPGNWGYIQGTGWEAPRSDSEEIRYISLYVPESRGYKIAFLTTAADRRYKDLVLY